jgi:hypothetical protein
MINFITEIDIKEVINVNNGCCKNDLELHLDRALETIIIPKIGYCFYKNIVNNPSNEISIKIIDGCEFLNTIHYGLKRAIIYFAYADYLLLKSYQDTPFGIVQKVHNDSLPVPINELNKIKSKYEDLAEFNLNKTICYIDTVRANELFSDCESDCETKTENRINYSSYNIEIIEK